MPTYYDAFLRNSSLMSANPYMPRHNPATVLPGSLATYPDYTVDNFPINWGTANFGNNYYQRVPGLSGLIAGPLIPYAQANPSRWNRLWSIGESAFNAEPSHRTWTDPQSQIAKFAESYLKWGHGALANLWNRSGGSTSGSILGRLYGVSIPDFYANHGRGRGYSVDEQNSIADQYWNFIGNTRSDPSMMQFFLGAEPPQQQQSQPSAFDAQQKFFQQLTPALEAAALSRNQPRQPPNWFQTGYNRSGESGFGSVY